MKLVEILLAILLNWSKPGFVEGKITVFCKDRGDTPCHLSKD